MTVSDPIADMLTRVRNAIMAKHDHVLVPASRMKLSIARILKEEGFINDYEVVRGKPHRVIKIQLKYSDHNQPVISGLERVSKPGLRVYAPRNKIPRVLNGLGTAVISSSKGVIADREARRFKVGGEIICYIW